jgi:thymidine kinase
VSFELISHFAHLRYTDISFGLYQSAKNIRNENVWSRNGVQIEAKKIKSLSEISEKDLKVVGIDEVHMFPEKEIEIIEKLLKRGSKVIVSGLDLDYRGEMFGTIKRLFELGPAEVKYKKAVCENCKSPTAIYTQIFKGERTVLEGLPPVVPEDGSYIYKPVCRNCFIKLDRF